MPGCLTERLIAPRNGCRMHPDAPRIAGSVCFSSLSLFSIVDAPVKMIVGLGNPGKKYEGTRHNIGFMVADELAKRWGITTWKNERSAMCAEHRIPEKVFLIKPTTYMNLSGEAVGAFANFYNIDPEDIAVIQDDLDLPCGKLRIRRKGSAGGHNGIKSIQQHLGTGDFPRFKIGIGHPERNASAVIGHVLHRFGKEEQPLIEEAVKQMADAVELWLKGDMDAVMQEYNTKKEKKKDESAKENN